MSPSPGRLGAILVTMFLLGACGASATTSPANTSTANTSTEASVDEALVADLAAVMSDPYDAATVEALYAANAVIHEVTADQTHTGLDEIGARIRYFNASKFEAVVTSAPIRQDSFVAPSTSTAPGATCRAAPSWSTS